jgi:hypothetical protein
MSGMTAKVLAVLCDSGSSPPTGLIQPQYLPALAQSRLLQLRFAELPPKASTRPIRSWFRKAVTRPLPRPR